MLIYTIADFDRTILGLFHQLAEAAGSFFTPVFRVITALGDKGLFFIILGLLFLCFKKTRKLGVMVLISMAIGYLVSNLAIKNIVRRPRPYAIGDNDYTAWWELTGQTTDSEFSFPSGHATVSAAFCICFIWHYGFKKAWPIIFLPLLIGITRLYFVVHYPTDILAGWTVGTLASLGAYYLTKLLDKVKFMNQFYSLKGIEDLFHKKKQDDQQDNQNESGN